MVFYRIRKYNIIYRKCKSYCHCNLVCSAALNFNSGTGLTEKPSNVRCDRGEPHKKKRMTVSHPLEEVRSGTLWVVVMQSIEI